MRRSKGEPPGDEEELERLRSRIDLVDRQVVELLNERARLTRSIGEAKVRLGRRVRDPEREREVLLRVSMANTGPTPQADLLAIYRKVIAVARGLEAQERDRAREAGGDSPKAG